MNRKGTEKESLLHQQKTGDQEEHQIPATSFVLSENDPVFDDSERSEHSSFRTILNQLTGTERKRALMKPGVGAAAFLIRDAVLGEQVENPAEGAYNPYSGSEEEWRNTVALLCARFCSSRSVLYFHHTMAWIMILLTFIEPPHWCRSSDIFDYVSDDESFGCDAVMYAKGIPADNSTTEEVQYYPNSSSMLVTTEQSHMIDGWCVALMLLIILLRMGRDGLSFTRYFRPGSSRSRRITQFTCLILIVVGLALKITVHHPYTRLFILWSTLHSARRDVQVVIGVLPETLNVLAILGVFMGFYAWFGTVMFVGTPEGREHFSSFIESLWTLYICVTTANYPDVMMPSFNDNRWTAVYFVSFMILSFFFLLNIILASIVNEYDAAYQARKMDAAQASNANLKQAYTLMDTNKNGRIDRETVMALFAILNDDFPEFWRLSEDEMKLLFAILDKDGSSTITEDEFMEFGIVLLLEFVKESDYASWVEAYFPKIFGSDWYQAFSRVVKSDYFEVAIDLILIMNAAIIGIQSYPELAGQVNEIDPKYFDGSVDTIWELMESIFTIIYIFEVGIKITVFGSKKYFERLKNVFDFTITMLAVITSAIVYYPNQINNTRLIRMIVMARVMRLIRLLTALPRFQLIGAISAEILPKAVGVFLVLFTLMYLFAALGVDLYGGLITRDPANPLSYLVLDTDFSNNDYWGNNFNDMISAMNVLFNLLVVNNWTQCEIGYEATTESRWVRLFFFAFHVLGVILINNLVIAFIINAFLQQLSIVREHVEEDVVDGEAVLRNRQALFDASTITGTKTGVSGGFIARFRRSHSETSGGHAEQEKLRLLFTQTSNEIPMSTDSSG